MLLPILLPIRIRVFLGNLDIILVDLLVVAVFPQSCILAKGVQLFCDPRMSLETSRTPAAATKAYASHKSLKSSRKAHPSNFTRCSFPGCLQNFATPAAYFLGCAIGLAIVGRGKDAEVKLDDGEET